jgi:CheY-like chemotaxis protein
VWAGCLAGEQEGDVANEAHQVLVVDDDASLREIYADALREHGHDVRTAADGAAALKVLQNGWTPCIVFLDLRMPGMDGWELSRRLREDQRYQSVPVVVVAGHLLIEHEASQIGAAAWLRKPFDLERLDQQTRALCPN